MQATFTGIMPAMTTPFHRDSTVDHDSLAQHCRWLVENGAARVVLVARTALPSVPFETVLQTSVPGQAGQQRREAVRDAVRKATSKPVKISYNGIQVLTLASNDTSPANEIRRSFTATLIARSLPASA